MKRITAIIFILCCFNAMSLYAETTAMLLDIAENAYEKNLGYGSVSLYDDIGGISANPSIIPNINSINGSFTYMNYLDNFNMFYGNFIYPNIKNFNILGRFGYFFMPSETDVETGEELNYSEFFFGLGTGYHFFDRKLSVGAILNFYTASIANESGGTLFADLGASYPIKLPVVPSHKIIFGLSLLNLGPGVDFIDDGNSEQSPLPASLNLGIQYIYDYDYKLFAGLKKYFSYEEFLFSLGGEINLLNTIFLRAAIIEGADRIVKYNIGIGFDLNYTDYHFMVDYVFLPIEGMDPSSVITLSFKFPLTEKKKEEIKKEEKNWENMWTSE